MDSGCKVLFLGLESVNEEQLKTLKKSMKDNNELKQMIKKMRKMGILIHASMIFGFDTDTKKVFRETVRFLIREKINTVSFNILTPYPGTKIYEDMKSSGRLITDDWKYYDHSTVVFRPKNMTPFELQVEKIKARARFYSISSFLYRMTGNLGNPIVFAAMNYGHMKQVRLEKKRLSELKSELFDH